MTYRIELSPLGTFSLILGNQLIMQAGNPDNPELARADCERVRDVLQDRGHAERVLRSVRYNAETNSIEDGQNA